MLRKLTFGFVLVTAFIVAACGRQVTPNPPGLGAGGALPGYMIVKFDVAGTFNFANYQYWTVFNTTGNGITPLTNPQQTNWKAYSTALLAAGQGGATSATLIQFLKNSNPAIPPTFFPIRGLTPQQLQYIPNNNGTNTEFQLTFLRSVFAPINSPSPGPSPSTSPAPFSNIWLFNAFVTQATVQNQLVFLDSMGSGGPTDTTFVSPALNINTCFDQVFYKQQDINPPSDPAAQIVSVEIANNPSPGPHSSPCP